jgi:CubicO group peptidase (beta-lactamase class C family)
MRLKTSSAWLVFAAMVATSAALIAQSGQPRTAVATKAELAPDRAERIDRALQRYVDENRIGGAVALVLRDGQPVYERAFGWSDKEAETLASTLATENRGAPGADYAA